MIFQNVLEILLRAKGGAQTEKELGKVQKSIKGVNGLAREMGLMLGLAGVTGGMVMFGKASMKASMQLEVAMNNMEFSVKAAQREFGAAIGTTQDWIDTVDDLSESMGIFSREEVATASARLVDMTKRLGFTADEMEVMLSRTADLSAGKVDLASGIERVSAAMRGEAESAEYLGLSLNENTVRAYAEAHGEVWKALTDTEKAGQRYLLFLEQTEEMTGRAADYADTEAGKVKKLTVAWGEFQAEFGKFLVVGGVVDALTTVAIALKEGAQAWQDAIKLQQAGGEVAKAQRLAKWSTAAAVATIWTEALLLGPLGPLAAQELPSLEERAEQFAQWAQDLGIVNIEGDKLTVQLEEMGQAEEIAAVAAKDNTDALIDNAEASEEAGEAAKARADALDAYTDSAREAARAEEDYAQERQDTVDEYGKRRVQMEASYANQREQVLEDFTRQQGRQLRDFQRREQQSEQAYYDQRQASADAFGRQIAQMEEDHQKKMGRMREDYDMRQEDAVGSRDAIAFLRNQRQYEVNRRRAEQDYGDVAGQRSEEYGRQLAEQEEQFGRQRNQRMADFQQRTTDQQTDFDLRRQREADQHQEMMTQYDSDHQERLTDMESAFADEKQVRDDALTDELTDQGVWLGAWSRQWREGEAQLEEDYAAHLTRMRGISGSGGGGPVNGRQTGGYAGLGMYQLGEAGREFVMSAGTTQAAEMMGGGGLTQEGLLAGLSRGSFYNSSSIVVNEATTPPAALAAMIQGQINDTLTRYAKGY